MSEKEYVVIAKEGVDLSALDAELAASSGSGCVPNRAVECTDACEHDTRMTHWNLTDEEAETLKNDERIYDVEIPYKDNPDVEYTIDAVKTNQWFSKSTSTSALYVNWGLHRCSSATDPFNDGTNLGAVLSIKNYHYDATTGKISFVEPFLGAFGAGNSSSKTNIIENSSKIIQEIIRCNIK